MTARTTLFGDPCPRTGGRRYVYDITSNLFIVLALSHLAHGIVGKVPLLPLA